MFRHRIRDLMIVNAVLAFVLASAIFLRSFVLVMVLAVAVGMLFLPLVLVETYLYRRKKGTWYRWQHPAEPRPRYVPLSDLPPYRGGGSSPGADPADPGELPAGRRRTRLFESGSPSESVSRGSILLKVAGGLESSGSQVAAMRIYQQVVEGYAGTPEAREAADRLRSIQGRELHAGRVESGG